VRWLAISRICAAGRRLYLAAVQDAYSRALVGWSMAEHMRAQLGVDVLGMGLARRPVRRAPRSDGTATQCLK
jgi:transposase InsO family protein